MLLRLLTRRGLLPGAREEGLRLRHHGDDGLLDLRVERDLLRGLLQADDHDGQRLRRQHGGLAAEVLLLEGALESNVKPLQFDSIRGRKQPVHRLNKSIESI